MPPKPSVQTRFVLDAIEETEQRDTTCWAHMNESIDLLFARVGDISKMQEQMRVNQELGTKAFEQVLRDQSVLAKQTEATRQAVAKLTLDQMGDDDSD